MIYSIIIAIIEGILFFLLIGVSITAYDVITDKIKEIRENKFIRESYDKSNEEIINDLNEIEDRLGDKLEAVINYPYKSGELINFKGEYIYIKSNEDWLSQSDFKLIDDSYEEMTSKLGIKKMQLVDSIETSSLDNSVLDNIVYDELMKYLLSNSLIYSLIEYKSAYINGFIEKDEYSKLISFKLDELEVCMSSIKKTIKETSNFNLIEETVEYLYLNEFEMNELKSYFINCRMNTIENNKYNEERFKNRNNLSRSVMAGHGKKIREVNEKLMKGLKWHAI